MLFAATAAAEDPWADEMLDYAPIDPPSNFTDPAKALGAPQGGGPHTPYNDDVVSLGSQGGSITLRFNTAVENAADNPRGLDFIVYSNAFWAGGNPQRRFQEPAIVEISEDVNGNGQPDDPWYLIPGSRGYSPDPFPSISEPPGLGNEDPSPKTVLAGFIVNPNSTDGDANNDDEEYNWGYAEMGPTAEPFLDNYVRPDDPKTVGIDARTGGGDAFDIEWTVDGNGNPANLERFHFIRITNFIDRRMAVFGPASPEIAAVADVAPDIDSDGDGILDAYETRVIGTDPNRRENTMLPLVIPQLEGGSGDGDTLGSASDGDGAAITLISAGDREGADLPRHTIVDIRKPTDPGGRVPGGFHKSKALREFQSTITDFTGAQLQPARLTIPYRAIDIVGLDEQDLEPFRLADGSYTREGISEVEVDAQANRVSFRSQYAALFLLASREGSGDADVPGPPTGTIELTASPAEGVVVGPHRSASITSAPIKDEDGRIVLDGTLVTVAVTRGRVAFARAGPHELVLEVTGSKIRVLHIDEAPNKAGVQIATDDGKISFGVLPSNQAGPVTITAESVDGDAKGSLDYAFLPGPPEPPIDFEIYDQYGAEPITAEVRSSLLHDQFGNQVLEGELFTVELAGADIVSEDAAPDQPGHQTFVSRDGRAYFTVQAGTGASWSYSVYGGESGDTSLSSGTFTPDDYPSVPLNYWPLAMGLLLLAGVLRLLRNPEENRR